MYQKLWHIYVLRHNSAHFSSIIDVAVHSCNPSSQEAEAERLLWGQGQLGVDSEFKAILDCVEQDLISQKKGCGIAQQQ